MYPTKPLWLTEYGFAHQNLADTQWYAQATNEYLDRLDYMDRYSWFGAFRSDVSNVGPNGAMLNERGLLTDIGSWYLGGEGNTGVVPRG